MVEEGEGRGWRRKMGEGKGGGGDSGGGGGVRVVVEEREGERGGEREASSEGMRPNCPNRSRVCVGKAVGENCNGDNSGDDDGPIKTIVSVRLIVIK